MAAKKKVMSPKARPKQTPSVVAARPATNRVTRAANEIQRQYGNNLGGAKTLKQAIQSLQGVVAESSLVDKYPSRILDMASTRVAQNAWNGLKRAEKYGKGKK